MRKTRFIVAALVLMLALSVTGMAAARAAVTIRLAGWSSSDAENAALQDEITNFMTANPDITVELNLSPSYDDTMHAAFASGDYPEVFYVDSSKLNDWVEAGVIAPADGKLEDVEDFYPSLLEVFTVDGQVMCAPKDFSTMTLQYNKDMFDAAGIAYPDDTWTWDNLKDAAAKLTSTNAAGDQVLGLVTPPNFERWLPFFYQAGGSLFDDSGALTLNSDAGTEALDYYVGLVSDGNAGPPSAVDAGWGGEAFGKGRVAMAMEGNWVINYLKTTFPDLHWGVAALPSHPTDNTRASMAFTVCYGVAADNQHPDESWKLVNFLTGKDGAQFVAQHSFGVMPTRASAADAWLTSFGADMKPFVDAADYSHKWVLPVGFQPFIDSFNSGLQQAFSGQMLTEDVLSEAQTTGEQILAGTLPTPTPEATTAG
jgi:multiple sugar transport system substrate-binding protein